MTRWHVMLVYVALGQLDINYYSQKLMMMCIVQHFVSEFLCRLLLICTSATKAFMAMALLYHYCIDWLALQRPSLGQSMAFHIKSRLCVWTQLNLDQMYWIDHALPKPVSSC